jgi:hypothetical protein
MVLTRGDDFPIHQTPEPIAYAGTDRNFYDRYFFNGYHSSEGELFFAVAFGVYPHLNIADAAFSLTLDGVQTSVHASRWLRMERMDLRVGPISIEVLEPLQRLRARVEAPDQGVRAELTFDGRSPPIEEPRFVRRLGPRTLMDYTRLTQNGRWTGWVERDGRRETVDGYVGTRDRSWGVRPVGARDAQELAPAEPPQFYWLWGPSNFEHGAFYFHSNDDALGRPWNRREVWAPDQGHEPGEEEDFAIEVDWKSGTRHASRCVVHWPGGGHTVTYEPEQTFFMLGIGYGHPRRAHGLNQGELSVEREDLTLADVDVRLPHHLHIQALSKVTYRGDGFEAVGRGVLEQLVLGPHAPSGFTELLDFAK